MKTAEWRIRLIVFLLCAFLPMVGIGILQHSCADLVLKNLSSAAVMLVPMIAVIAVQLVSGETVFAGTGISFRINRWWIAGWLMMPTLSLATVGVTLLMPGAVWTPDSEAMQMMLKSMPEGFGVWGIVALTLISGLCAGATINAVFAFGEEVAWRGFLLHLFKDRKFIAASLWIGLIWGIWHAPVILNGHNYPQHPVIGVFMMVALCCLLTPLLLYFRIKSGSVIVPAVMHGTYNAVAGLSLMVISPANDLMFGCAGLAGMAVLLIADVCIFLYDRFVSRENIFMTAV